MPPTTPADSDRTTLWLYVFALLAFWAVVGIWTMHQKLDDLPYSEFKENLAANHIADVWLDGKTLYCRYARSNEQFRTDLEEPLPHLKASLDKMHVPLHDGRPPSTPGMPWWLVQVVLPLSLILIAWRVFRQPS